MQFSSNVTNTSQGTTVLGRVVTASSTASATSNKSYADARMIAERDATFASNTMLNTQLSLINTATNYVFTVNTLEDSLSPGTLRDCIIQSNKLLGSKITFSVSGTIYLNSDLPTIETSINIDGSTAPLYNIEQMPVITIDGQSKYNTIVINNNGCVGSIINAVVIKQSITNGISIYSSNNKITNCYIIDNLQNGIYLNNCSNNIIGELKYSKKTGQKIFSNLISGNLLNGIDLNFSLYNNIFNNNIGTDDTGNIAYSNLGSGILINTGSDNNILGGPLGVDANGVSNNPTGSKGTTTPVFIVPPLGNLISGNMKNGVTILTSADTRIFGNFIGTTYDGTHALGNKENGIFISNSSYTKLYGCGINNEPFLYYNVISGNKLNGILLEYSSDNIIQGNFIGISSHNNKTLGNGLDGLFVGRAASNITVGGVIPLGNVISGNLGNGIHLSEDSNGFESYNTFAGLFAFGGAAPNHLNGMLIDNVSNNSVIGKVVDRTNIFSGNLKNGIEITDQANNITIEAIICGGNSSGDKVIPNQENGIFIHGDSNNISVGNKVNSIIFKSVIVGNKENGILISENSNFNSIYNCNIGTNISEKINLGNGSNGIYINNLSNNNIVTDVQKTNNVIVNNKGYGVKLGKDVMENIVTNNYIGINRLHESFPNLKGTFNTGYKPSNKTEPNYTN